MAKTESELIIRIGGLTEFSGKAVQLYVNKTPFLILGNSWTFEHANLLNNVLKYMKIPFNKIEESYRPELGDKNGKYWVPGMGYFKVIDESPKKILLSRDSESYEIGIDENHAEDLNFRLKDIKVSVRDW